MVKPGYKQTEIGVIPEDWIVRRLSECTKRVGVGLATSVTQHYREDGIPIFRNLNIKPGYLDDSDILYLDPDFASHQESKKIRTGDVLTVHTGYVGISCVVPAKYNNALTFTTLITTTDDTLLLPEFLSIYLNSSFGALEIESLQAGGGRNNLNVNDFVNFRIPVPTISEQHKIIEYIKEIERYLELTSQQLAKKKAIKQGTMQELLTGKKRLPGFSGEWKTTVFGNACTIGRGGSPRPIQEYLTTDDSGINWIKIGDVKPNAKYITSTHERITENGSLMSRRVCKGDFILSNSMSFGRPYILKIDGCIHDGWLAIQDYHETFDTDFLYYLLGSSYVFEQYVQMAAGSSVQNLNKEKVAKLIVNIPSTDEQKTIASILSFMDSEIEVLEQKLAKYRQVKQGMMQQLLTGKIRLV